MPRAFVIQNEWTRDGIFNRKPKTDRKVCFSRGFSNQKNSKIKQAPAGGAKINQTSLVFALLFVIFLSGIFYLYQVNFLATQGFEIREIENKIKEAEKESKQLKLKEIELRSMPNIEKTIQDLDLVDSANVTYLEFSGSMALK